MVVIKAWRFAGSQSLGDKLFSYSLGKSSQKAFLFHIIKSGRQVGSTWQSLKI